MKREQTETWRELVKEPGERSLRDRWRMWGMILGGAGVMLLPLRVSSLLWGETTAPEEVALAAFGLFLFGAGGLASGVSEFLIYRRRLTDKGLLRAGVIHRIGWMIFGPALLLVARPWHYVPNVLSPVECGVVCAVVLFFSTGFGGVSLVRLLRAYRRKDQPEEKPERTEKQKQQTAKRGFWLLGLLLLALLLVDMMIEFRYQSVKAEYESLRAQSFEETFDRERYNEVEESYRTLYRWARRGRHDTVSNLLILGILLLLWILALLGRIISRAAWRSVERDQERERKRALRERNKDPWD